MILLQLSAGQGPDECARGVYLALKSLHKACDKESVDIEILETVESKREQCLKSVLIRLSGDKASIVAKQWHGQMLWTCTSMFRPKHKRKNWFFSGQVFEINEQKFNEEIQFQACRASGAGGQHVNTTDSAVQAVHVASGISVRVEAARSQHANKRLAKLLIMQKLAALQSEKLTQQDKQRWAQHHSLQRGDPVKVFKGMDFIQQM